MSRERKRKKCIEVVEGYISNGETGHVQVGIRFGLRTWNMPVVYHDCPNNDNFRKVKITIQEVR